MDIEGVPFKFVDVGGQRTQRQRWFQVQWNKLALNCDPRSLINDFYR